MRDETSKVAGIGVTKVAGICVTKVAGRREVRSAETHEGQETSAAKGGPALSDSDGHVANAIRGAPLRAHRAQCHTVLAVARCSMFTYFSYLSPVLRSHTVGFV